MSNRPNPKRKKVRLCWFCGGQIRGDRYAKLLDPDGEETNVTAHVECVEWTENESCVTCQTSRLPHLN